MKTSRICIQIKKISINSKITVTWNGLLEKGGERKKLALGRKKCENIHNLYINKKNIINSKITATWNGLLEKC